ncbi:glycosyl hydrolase family 95 catalytic domain-containing protein [Haloferula sp.]|uniref:glycoside hydrolase family 95 protein n=1 Tax=Haloferula sp. TaxID=2497595 RepID=UPI00329B66E3
MINHSYLLALTLCLSFQSAVDAKREPWTSTKLDGYDRSSVFQGKPEETMDPTTLWFSRPASKWEQALPVGNGTFGAMVFGGIERDVIQFNHLELWLPPTAGEKFLLGKLPDKTEAIKKARKLLFDGKPHEAHRLIDKELLVRAKNRFQGMGSYAAFGLLHFDYDYKGGSKQVGNYVRALDMSSGVTHTRFSLGATSYERETFVSDDLNVVAVRMKANGPDTISTKLNFSRPVNFPHQKPETGSLGNDAIYLKGIAHGQKKTAYDTSYAAVARAFVSGGEVASEDGVLTVRGARELFVILAGSTNFNKDEPYKPMPRDLVMDSKDLLNSFQKAGWKESRSAATTAHSELFDRVHLRLGPEKKNDIPVDRRLGMSSAVNGITEEHTRNYDGLLDTQLFQLGRYILITSARGEVGPPLSGLWNSELMPMWSGDYHHNINTQMFYWPAEVTNLSECHESYVGMMERQLPSAKKLASEMLGCRGAAVGVLNGMHHSILPSMPPRAFWVMGGAWSATHIMDHYRFGRDREFLKERGYPVLKEHVKFCLDWMVRDPNTGKWVLGPDVSPENTFLLSEEDRVKKRWGQEDMGTAMDQQLAWQLFHDYLEASKVLGKSDDAIVAEVNKVLPQLETTHLRADGRIREWSRDYVDGEPTHRHVSHLFGFYPGYQFHTGNAPEMVEGAKKTLEVRSRGDRGAGKIGWSISWLVALHARFYDAEKSFEFLTRYHSEKVIHPNLMGKGGNALEQSAGLTAGMAEMLLQSHRDEIELLPALPEVWSEGEVSGLVARGGFEVSMEWKNGKLTHATILSRNGGSCQLRYKDVTVSLECKKGETLNLKDKLVL